jgi:modulator of FtsH protease
MQRSTIIDISPIGRTAGMNKVYGLLAIALLLTLTGTFLGMTVAAPLLFSPFFILLLIAELVLVFTATWWSRSAPVNYILFAAFPFLSGLTLTPVIISVLAGYANGGAILMNALLSTALLTASAAVLSTLISDSMAGTISRFMLLSLIGLIIFGLLQFFVPSLRTAGVEMLASGAGVVAFSLFLTVDIKRLSQRADLHSPFLLALSLYLDIYNLFLYVLRFMLAFSGRRD